MSVELLTDMLSVLAFPIFLISVVRLIRNGAFYQVFITLLLIIDNIQKAHSFCAGVAKFMGAGAVEAHSIALVEDVCFAGNVGF